MTADSLAVSEHERLRQPLLAALNGYKISMDDAWAILKQWQAQAALVERLEQAEAALNCDHPDGFAMVEHEGKTWHRCGICGLLELWEGGMFMRAALAAIPREEPPK